ncbi:hypothetical protein HDU67_010434, partial [Dinochytrium kinnereticum]
QQTHQPQGYDALSGVALESQLWTTKTFIDAMFHRIITLEAENDALRRRETEAHRLPAFGGVGGERTAASFGFGFHSTTTSSSSSSSSSAVNAAGSQQPPGVAVAAEGSGEVDWKAACERALEEVGILRGELERRNGEFERLESAHKNCGYLQGLLAICD